MLKKAFKEKEHLTRIWCFGVFICRVNKPYLPIAAGDLSVKSAWMLVTFFAVAGFSIVALNFGPFITSLYTLGLFLGTIYSVPPFRMKRFPVAAFLIIATVLNWPFFFSLLLLNLCRKIDTFFKYFLTTETYLGPWISSQFRGILRHQSGSRAHFWVEVGHI